MNDRFEYVKFMKYFINLNDNKLVDLYIKKKMRYEDHPESQSIKIWKAFDLIFQEKNLLNKYKMRIRNIFKNPSLDRYASIAIEEIPLLKDFEPSEIGINTVLNYGLYKTLDIEDWEYLLENTNFIEFLLKHYKIFYYREVIGGFLGYLYQQTSDFLVKNLCDIFNKGDLEISSLVFGWLVKDYFTAQDYEIFLSRVEGNLFRIIQKWLANYFDFYDSYVFDEYLQEIYKIPESKLIDLLENILKGDTLEYLFEEMNEFFEGLPEREFVVLIHNPEIRFVDRFFKIFRRSLSYLGSWEIFELMSQEDPKSFFNNVERIFTDEDLPAISALISHYIMNLLDEKDIRKLIENYENLILILKTQEIIYTDDYLDQYPESADYLEYFFRHIEEKYEKLLTKFYVKLIEKGSVYDIINLIRLLILKTGDVIPNHKDIIVHAFKKASLPKTKLRNILTSDLSDMKLFIYDRAVPIPMMKYRFFGFLFLSLRVSTSFEMYVPIIKTHLESFCIELKENFNNNDYDDLKVVVEDLNHEEILEVFKSAKLDLDKM